MEENTFTNTLAIKFLCFISIIFVFLNILEIEKIYLALLHSISLYKNNIRFLDECVKFPLLSKAFFSLFSLFFSISAAIFTILISIQVEFFLGKCLLTYIYYNFYLFGPYLLFSSFFAMMNFDKVFHHCQKTDSHVNFLLRESIKATSLIYKQQIENNFSDNLIRSESVFPNNNYVSVSNIFNLVTTITVSFLLCLSMALYETYFTYYCSILRKDGGNPIIGKIFWFVVSKNRKFRIYRRDPVEINVANNRNLNNNNEVEISNNSRDLINNENANEETSLLVRSEHG